jgi:dihydrofolate reductase
MRRLKIIEHISLDGVMQNSRDDNDFPYGDWTASYRTPAGREMVMAIHGERFDLVLGRRTYDLWSGFWPTAPSSPIGARINAATKYVATHRGAATIDRQIDRQVHATLGVAGATVAARLRSDTHGLVILVPGALDLRLPEDTLYHKALGLLP